MKKPIAIISTIIMSTSITAFAANLQPKLNLDTLKGQIVKYHESGEYTYDIKQVANEAQSYINKRVAENNLSKHPEKLAMILDIDETSLSNYKDLKKLSFGGTPDMQNKAEGRADDVAIEPTLNLYKYALKKDITVFFITGRTENYRTATIKNLVHTGYTSVSKSTKNCENSPVNDQCLLYLRDGKYLNTSAIPYKTAMRQKIEKAGYTIIVNVGDQYSDLAGGFSERTYKYPDFMYYIS